MRQICKNSWCCKEFTISEDDRKFASRFEVNFSPKFCATCRHLQRLNFKGNLVFHKRKSSLSGKPIISLFSKNVPFPVYSIEEWWSDAWDATSFGISFDSSKRFFDQLLLLNSTVPRMANFNENTENSDYSSYSGQTKNAYYSDVAFLSEDIFYCDTVTGKCSSLCDCLQCYGCNYLVECVQCRMSALSTHLWLCNGCRDSHFCYDCQGCSDCIFCTNLRNKKYCIRNEELTPEAYLLEKKKLLTGSYQNLLNSVVEWKSILSSALFNALQHTNCEDCTGDTLSHCAQCHECFECMNCEDCRFCAAMQPSKKALSCMELTSCGIGEMVFNSVRMGRGNYFCRMCSYCRASSNLTYCMECFSCEFCFGCIGLKSKKYCILNRQFSKEEYFHISNQIIQSMKESNDWGGFFPEQLSPFTLNDSCSEVPEVNIPNMTYVEHIPDLISDVSSEITKQIFLCELTSRPFRVLAPELEIYKNLNYPLPRKHPDIRMKERRELLRKWELFQRNCTSCSTPIESSIDSVERKVHCEKCYLEKVY